MREIKDSREKLDHELLAREKDIRTAKLDISFGELASMYSEGDLVIDPAFQRLFRWDAYQKTRLIETILIGLPMPSIFVVQKEDSTWELIDGLQRLSTVFSFIGTRGEDEKWKLKEGDILKEIKNLYYDDLSPRAKRNIRRYTCRVEIISYDADYDVRYELFERLNTGGSPLSDQEIRNAIYRAESEDFNNFLNENGEDKEFLNLINISEPQRDSLYADELVLRFCALNESNKITKNLKDFLNEYMKNKVKESIENPSIIRDLELIFKRTVYLLSKLEDPNLFWRKRGGFSATLYDGIMVGVSRNINLYEDDIELLRDKVAELKDHEEFSMEYSGSGAHNAKKVMGRINIATEVFGDVVDSDG